MAGDRRVSLTTLKGNNELLFAQKWKNLTHAVGVHQKIQEICLKILKCDLKTILVDCICLNGYFDGGISRLSKYKLTFFKMFVNYLFCSNFYRGFYLTKKKINEVKV